MTTLEITENNDNLWVETDDYTPLWLEIPFSEDEAETLL